MEHLAGVVDRIRTIQSRVAAVVPTEGFATALASAAERPASTLPDAGRFSAPSAPQGTATPAPASLTLAQMLGRPVGGTGRAPAIAPPADLALAASVGTAGTAPGGRLRLPVDARVSSVFGPRIHPVTGRSRRHAGIDLAAPTGTPIGAAAAGTVTFVGVRGGYGNLVIVDHGNGEETRYAHQDTIAVAAGQRVAVGQVLGTVGSTGQSTGPHLHFELRRDGQPVDPAPALGLG